MRTLISSLLLIAHFTSTLSAPTVTPTDDNVPVTTDNIITSTFLELKPTQQVEISPTTTTKNDDSVTTVTASILKIPSTAVPTTADENLIGSSRLPEAAESSTQTTFKDNETIKIHENHESTTTGDVHSTIEDAGVSTVTTTVVQQSPVMNVNKSINFDISTTTATVTSQQVQSTIEIPNVKLKSDTKKAKLKDAKKKVLNESKIAGKAWIQKQEQQKSKQQKILMDVNYSTVPTFTTVHETDGTEPTAISTSIKTVPTTIKSTTLTSTTETRTQPAATTESPIPATINANELKTSVTADVHANNNNNTDNVIVLNSNSSGLIVVDVMENFGKENTTNSFEIKMDLIDDVAPSSAAANVASSDNKDEIFTVSTSSMATIPSQVEKNERLATTTSNDDIILVNEGNTETTTSSHGIKWNEVKHNEGNGDIKITFDNIDLPHQNVNVSIENGELIIDSLDISVLNRAEEELRKEQSNMTDVDNAVGNKTNSLEIVLIEDPTQDDATTKKTNHDEVTIKPDDTESHPATIHFELPNVKHSGSGDDIKIKTTDKDSDTIFYISNTEVKLIESIPTMSPSEQRNDKKKYPAIYEEDVIVDVPATTVVMRNHTTINRPPIVDKYEEDIVLSPLTSDFDPKDINYIGEAFLDVEESSNNAGGLSENHHIIPLTSDVVVQPVELKDMPSINIPIIGEPPQIELAEMMFSDDYENGNMNSKQQTNFHVEEEFSPFFLNSRLVKNELQADEPRELDTANSTWLLTIPSQNRTHNVSVNTMINGTNMTTVSSPYSNVTAAGMLESEDIDSTDSYDIQTLLLACLGTLAPLFLLVIIVLIIRFCWQKYRRYDTGNDLISDKSTDPLAEKQVGGSIDEMKSTESAMTLNRGNGNLQSSTELLLANGDVTQNNTNSNHNDTNGSIIKMTMKNNHLIVETEERNDISRDTRETKMHYSPSEKDGVFIVEAARGADQNGSHKPSPSIQKSSEAPLEIPEEIKIDTLQSHFTPSSPEEERKQPKPEQVEIHTPPADVKNVQPTDGAVICNGTKTGLSQSDLSLTSSNSSNQNYTYGDRDAYNFDEKGYRGSSPKRIINVHCHDLKPLIENSPPTTVDDLNKPVITSAIFKNDSQEDVEPLKSDMMARTNGNNESNDTTTTTAAARDDNDNADKTKVHNKMNGIISSIKNGLDEIISVPDENCNDTIIPPPCLKTDCNGELTMDSLSYLPAPPLIDDADAEQNASELMSMDSFPPPPPLES